MWQVVLDKLSITQWNQFKVVGGKMKSVVQHSDKIFSSVFSSGFIRDCVPRVPVCSLLWALHHRALLLPGWHLQLQESLALCRRLLALLPLLDVAPLPGLEQLWPWGTRDHMLRPVAPPLAHQHLICVVSLHLLPSAAPSTHGLLLWPNPACNQEGEWIPTCYQGHNMLYT